MRKILSCILLAALRDKTESYHCDKYSEDLAEEVTDWSAFLIKHFDDFYSFA